MKPSLVDLINLFLLKLERIRRGDVIIFNDQYEISQKNAYKNKFEFHEVAQYTQVIFALAS